MTQNSQTACRLNFLERRAPRLHASPDPSPALSPTPSRFLSEKDPKTTKLFCFLCVGNLSRNSVVKITKTTARGEPIIAVENTRAEAQHKLIARAAVTYTQFENFHSLLVSAQISQISQISPITHSLLWPPRGSYHLSPVSVKCTRNPLATINQNCCAIFDFSDCWLRL
jgi:hypothetical protein